MVTLEGNRLVFRFPEVHERAVCSIEFQRTLRLPDDNQEYPLPPGFGRFPLTHVDDFASRLPGSWRDRGGVFFPMYQAEAMWICFVREYGMGPSYPFAIKIAAGKINTVSGASWTAGLADNPQDYVVVPAQPWLDGFCVAEGKVRQFIAMPLGAGYTAEEQITGEGEFGGIQISAFPMKREFYDRYLARMRERDVLHPISYDELDASAVVSYALGLAPGGLMSQGICEDEHGIDAWDLALTSRCFVHLLNAEQYLNVTGTPPPTKPPTAKDYAKAGLPWFDYYDRDRPSLLGSRTLARLASIGAKAISKNESLVGNEPVAPQRVVVLGPSERGTVRNGNW